LQFPHRIRREPRAVAPAERALTEADRPPGWWQRRGVGVLDGATVAAALEGSPFGDGCRPRSPTYGRPRTAPDLDGGLPGSLLLPFHPPVVTRRGPSSKPLDPTTGANPPGPGRTAPRQDAAWPPSGF
jgi:hypothetical protein